MIEDSGAEHTMCVCSVRPAILVCVQCEACYTRVCAV